MTRFASRYTSTALSAVLFATPLAASAQDAITLETIGAVRMAAPDEVQRMNAAQDRSTSKPQEVVRAAIAETTTVGR